MVSPSAIPISIVTEASSANIMEILTNMTGSILISIIGILDFLWVLRHPTMAIAASPLAGFFVLNIFIGNEQHSILLLSSGWWSLSHASCNKNVNSSGFSSI